VILDDCPVVGVECSGGALSLRQRDVQHAGQIEEATVVQLLLDAQRRDAIVVEVDVTEVRDASPLLASNATELLEVHVYVESLRRGDELVTSGAGLWHAADCQVDVEEQRPPHCDV
jgi:hypothetical protein